MNIYDYICNDHPDLHGTLPTTRCTKANRQIRHAMTTAVPSFRAAFLGVHNSVQHANHWV